MELILIKMDKQIIQVIKFLKEFVNASIDAKQVVNQNNINLIFELIDEVKLIIRKNKDLFVLIGLINTLINK